MKTDKKKSDLLFDEILPQLQKEAGKPHIAEINNEADIARVAVWLKPLLEASPRLGHMFLADTEAFCSDMGIKLGPVIQRHYRENVGFSKSRDSELYQSLKDGKPLHVGVEALRFNLSPELQKHLPNLKPSELTKLDPAALDWSLAARFFAPPQASSRRSSRANGISVGPAGQIAEALTTGGWNVVMQVDESFFAELYNLFFLLEFVASDLGTIVSGGNIQTTAVDRQYSFLGWFLTWFQVKFAIANPPLPRFVLDHGSPRWVRVDMDITGTISMGSTPNNLGQPTPFTAVVTQWGELASRAQGSFVGAMMSNYYAVPMTGDTQVDLGQTPDVWKEAFIASAVKNYFANELPELFILPTVHNPPFITFDQSSAFVVDDGARQAITLTFGPPANPSDSFPEILYPPGRNVTLGIHRGAALQQIIQNIPDLPIHQGSTTIKTIDVNLRDGYIEVTGRGFVDTCVCYPSVDFEYTAEVTLKIDNNGQLIAEVGRTNVTSTWANVHAILVSIFGGPVGAVVATIGFILFKFVAGNIVHGQVQDHLNVDQNFNEQFSREFPFGRIEANFTEVQITLNGIFIHGDLAAELNIG